MRGGQHRQAARGRDLLGRRCSRAWPASGGRIGDQIGIAALGYLLFKGIQCFVAKSAAPTGPQAPAAVKSTAPAGPEAIPAEIVTVIAAAVATVTGSSHRIVSIKSQPSHWEKAGRQSVLTSHRIR